jgi:hypothetical protein
MHAARAEASCVAVVAVALRRRPSLAMPVDVMVAAFT